MSYFAVPDFDFKEDDQHLISNYSTTHHNNEADEMMELLWLDGQVVAQPQHQHDKSQFSAAVTPVTASHQYQQHQQQQQHYMAEDEMATWLHYPTEDLYSELLCNNQQTTPLPATAATVRQPPVAPPQQMVAPPPQTVAQPMNFPLFSRMRGKNHEEVKPELTVVESNTMAATTKTTMKSVEVSSAIPSGGGGGETLWETGGGSGDMTLSSSSGVSGGGPANTTAPPSTASDEAGEKVIKGDPDDRKRKRTAVEDSIATPTAATDQDVELEADDDEKKHPQGSHSLKRTRAAEVHNLSERRRRDRINEKMKALQELIPRCNKSDKASMLDEVIEYLKSLQMQVQMMSMGCGMVPMMYAGMQQQYMPPMGMAMGMDMGMNRPVMPFPPNIPVSTFPTTPAVAAGTQFAPNFSIPAVRMPSVPGASNFSINQGSNQADSVHGSYPLQIPGLPQLPNIGDPYQQFMALQQMQMQMQMQGQSVQNQSFSQPGSSKPSTSKSEAKDDK